MALDTDLFQRFDEICRRRNQRAQHGHPAEGLPPLAPVGPGKANVPPTSVGIDSVKDARISTVAVTSAGTDSARDLWIAERAAADAEIRQLEAEGVDGFLQPQLDSSVDVGGGRGRCQTVSAPYCDGLRSEAAALTCASAAWSDALWGGAGRLRKRVGALAQNSCARVRPGQLTVISRCVEREFATFKAQQRQQFEAMAIEEAELERALEPCARRFESWLAEPTLTKSRSQSSEIGCRVRRSSRPGCPATRSGAGYPIAGSPPPSAPAPGASQDAVVAASDPQVEQIKQELAELDDEEKRAGGPTGGWPTGQHDTFLRIYRMYKSQASPAFYARMEERFGADFPRAKISAHIDWLEAHERRQAQRRQLYFRWRERRTELESQAAEREKDAEARDAEMRRLAEKREKKVHEEQRQKVAEWRREKAEEEQRAALLRWTLEQEQARKLEKEQTKQRVAQKEAVDAYRRHREAENSRAREAARARSSSSRRRLSQEDRQRIAQRNLDILRKKLQAQEQAQNEIEASAQLAAARSREFEHVESRLYDTTESFIQKIAPKTPQSLTGAETRVPPTDRLPPRPPQGDLKRPSSARAIRGV